MKRAVEATIQELRATTKVAHKGPTVLLAELEVV